MTATPDFTWLFVNMVIGLVLVLALAFVLFRYVLPRMGLARRFKRGVPWAALEDVVRLDSRNTLYLVKVLERYLVLGVSENAFSLITELSPADGEKITGGGKQ